MLINKNITEFLKEIIQIGILTKRERVNGSNDLSLYEGELSGNYKCQQIEINSYPDSPLFISTGFLPRVSSMRLN